MSNDMWRELYLQLNISAPTTLSLLLYKLPWLVSLHFVGQLGPEELSAAALATTVCNVTGMSISLGMSSALSTLTGQSLGRIIQDSQRGRCEKDIKFNYIVFPQFSNSYNNQKQDYGSMNRDSAVGTLSSFHETVLDEHISSMVSYAWDESAQLDSSSLIFTLLFRGILLPYTIIFPVGLWWLSGIKSTLVLLGQEEDLSEMTQAYLRVLVPGLWSYSINWTLSAWMQTLNMADIPAYAAACGLILHIPSNIIFVNVLGLGYIGVALATVLFQFIQPFIMVSFLLSHRGRRRLSTNYITSKSRYWREFKEALELRGITRYLRLAGPGIVIITEWWASEAVIFLGGCLKSNPEYALGTLSLYQSINTFCVMFPMGLSTSCSTRVGILLGKNDFRGAKFACKVSMYTAIAVCLFISCCLFITPHTFLPGLFTRDHKLIDEASNTIPLLAIYVIADGLQVTMNGAIRGCGKQYLAVPVVVTAYWFIGVPIAYVAAFHYNLGTIGLVLGITIGTWLHMLLLWIVLYLIDWKSEAENAQTTATKELNEQFMTAYQSIEPLDKVDCNFA